MWRPRCEEHGIQCCRHPSCWFLKTAYCSASHDSSCCAYQMLITQCVMFQPEVCYSWLQKVIDICCWTASENLFTWWQDRARKHRRGCCHFRRRDFVFQQVHALWRRLSPLLHCSDGSVSVTLVARSASLVLQDDILLPLCPVAIVKLLLVSMWT